MWFEIQHPRRSSCLVSRCTVDIQSYLFKFIPDTWSNYNPPFNRQKICSSLVKPNDLTGLNQGTESEHTIRRYRVCSSTILVIPSSQKDENWYKKIPENIAIFNVRLLSRLQFMYLYRCSSFISRTSGKVSSNETPWRDWFPMLPSVPD